MRHTLSGAERLAPHSAFATNDPSADPPAMASPVRIVLLAGTRPEAVKMAPVVEALQRTEGLEPVLVVTAQHREMMDQALGVFGLRPDRDLNLMRPYQTLPDLTAGILRGVSAVLQEERPWAVLVQGDTTTAFAGALAAFYEGIPIGHVEAGLRTYDLAAPWPEEGNRRLIDPLARWCWAPTSRNRENLLGEGIPADRIAVTGNTGIDALLRIRERQRAEGMSARTVAERCGIPTSFRTDYLEASGRPWILVTGHRRESFGEGFERICTALLRLTEEWPELGILYPVHLNPRVREPVELRLSEHPRIVLIPPAGYLDFVWLMGHATVLLTDSGGIQEEAPSLGKPVLVLRASTERPEGLEAGTAVLVGTNPDRISREVEALLSGRRAHPDANANPYGDGRAAERIAAELSAHRKGRNGER